MDYNGKLRPFYVLRLLYEQTDGSHPLSTGEIVDLLDVKYGIKTQRTRIPQDVDALERFGFEIGRQKSQSTSYYFDSRLFELPELKLLIDAVESSSFITEKKSAELIQKLTSLASPYKASTLAKLSEVGGNPKQGNEQIYYIIDTIKNPFRFNISDLLTDDAVYRDALTEAQQRKYLQFIKDYGNDNYYDDIVILVETGLRISELYGLTTSDVDLVKRRVHVRRQLCRTGDDPYFITTPKSNSGVRTVPLSDSAYEAFRHALSHRAKPQVEMMIDGVSGFIFLDKDGRPKVAMHCQNYMRNMQK